MTSPAISGYTFDSCRGSGAFGSVWKALWNGEFECAVKVLTPGMWHPQYLSWCLERLRREGERTDLVRIFSYDLANDPPHVSMALMPEGTLTLEQLAGRLPAREAWTLLDSVAKTLGWLHGEGMVHTGLSCGNVFVCGGAAGEPVVLLSDIGQGWLSGAPVSHLHSQISCIAPEHWRGATQLLQEGRAQGRDVYAFGVVAWRLLTGSWPRGPKVFDAVAASRSEDLKLETGPFADWLEKEELCDWPAEAVSDEERDRRALVLQCLALDPAERPADMNAVLGTLAKIALPPPAVAAPVESIALEAGGDANGDGKVDSADAFAAGESAPRRRGFLRPALGWASVFKRRGESPAAGAGPWRWAAVAAILASVGLGAYAFRERGARITAASDRDALRREHDELKSRLPRAEAAAASSASEAAAARAELAAAARHSSVALIRKVLATEPVEETELPAWRRAVGAVAEECQALLDSAPPDAAGMESRWQLARLKTALGDEDGALPVLEKLSRDLEAAAIAAGQDFPAELVRLTGRAAALTGRILTSRNRAEDATPHLRKASDSFDRWLATHSDDTESARALANNLLLEGRALAARGQADQARAALMKIEGLVGKPDDSGFKHEDRFLLADVQMELGRLDAAQSAALPAADPASKEPASQLLQSAISRHSDGLKLLLDYDSTDRKSVTCRTRMARGYAEFGRLLIRDSQPRDASVAYGESVKLYSELMQDFEDNISHKLELASVYNEAALLIRNTRPGAAGAVEALSYQDFSVSILNKLNESNPLDNRIRLLLALSLSLNGELIRESADRTNLAECQARALKRQTEAITLTGELLAENTLSEAERREARRISARAWTATAGLHEKAGRRDDTVVALTKALSDWESSPVDDPGDQKLMAWVKERLGKLK